MKVQGVLHLKKLEYELEAPAGPGDLKKWSPVTGKIPAAEINGESVYDSTFINRRLEALYPVPPMWSSDPTVRSAQHLLEDWADESLYFHLMALRLAPQHADDSVAQITATMSPVVRTIAKPVLKRSIRGIVTAQGMGRLPVDLVVRELGERMDDLERQLGDGAYFFADEPSAADLGVAAQLECGTGGPTPEFGELLKTRPKPEIAPTTRGPDRGMARVSFQGFSKELPRFLAKLQKNNNRDWFERNRDIYEEHYVEAAKNFVATIGPKLQKIAAVDAEPRVNGAIMRINRDVRFAKDKRPLQRWPAT